MIAAWAWLPELGGIRMERGDGARGLMDLAIRTGAEMEDVPAHWRALPTGVDLQVHLRFPGQASKETLEGGLASALAGGVDTVLTMPNTNPFLDDPAVLAAAIRDVRGRNPGPVDVLFSASGTRGMTGEAASPIADLVRAGAVAVTDDGWGVRSPEAMKEVLRACASAGVPFLQHAEMPGHRGVAAAGDFQRASGLPEYPRGVESQMVRRDVELLRGVPGARYHVLHVTTKDTLEEVRRAKEMGLPVTCEVTPHHLFFSHRDIPPESDPRSASFKMNPPLFDPADRDALRAALASGLVDFVSTDHAPHEAENKRSGWRTAPFGTRGLETMLPVLTALVHEGVLSWGRLEEVFSLAARKFIGASRVPGLLFVDPEARWTVEERHLPGISRNSCFLGARLTGRLEWRGEAGRLYRRIPGT
ncbi:MAG: amidohydrolase family protein [Bdellovibrionales bacterium]|nr:amidohydrolase family protein [Bdellovibrionales bacterium]